MHILVIECNVSHLPEDKKINLENFSVYLPTLIYRSHIVISQMML